jgi:hypothetical protein
MRYPEVACLILTTWLPQHRGLHLILPRLSRCARSNNCTNKRVPEIMLMMSRWVQFLLLKIDRRAWSTVTHK